MKPTTVVNLRRSGCDIQICRPSALGNPFRGPDAIDKFREYAIRRIDSGDRGFIRAIVDCEGMELGCWCAPEPCHGDVIVTLIPYAKLKLALDN